MTSPKTDTKTANAAMDTPVSLTDVGVGDAVDAGVDEGLEVEDEARLGRGTATGISHNKGR